MWFKKESRNKVDYYSVNNITYELIHQYKTDVVLKPRSLEKSKLYKIVVWVYLAIPSYIITVEEDFKGEETEVRE